MALINKADPDEVGARLADWISGRLAGGAAVDVTRPTTPSASGLSSSIYLFDATWEVDGAPVTRSLVARVAPTGPGLFPVYDLESEYRIMRILGERTTVPVPPMLGMEPDPALLGAPFLVMEARPGRALPDDPPFTVEGWVLDLSAADQATLYDNGLAQVAAVHAVDWRGLGFEFMDKPQFGRTGIEQQMGILQNLNDRILQGRPNATIDPAMAWLRANLPEDDELVLSWGDSRQGNILFDADLSVTALLDWEMATIGSRELDLGIWLYVQRLYTEAIGLPLPPGFPDAAGTIERYVALTGYEPRNIDFYETMGCVRSSIIMVRFADLMDEGGILPEGSQMRECNPATQLLATMRGLPVPEGVASSYVGQRG